MKPEQKAREKIDNKLTDAGWSVQDYSEVNLSKSLGVAVREFPLNTGFADYLLFIGKKAVGVIEAKSEGTTLSGVTAQSGKYLFGLPKNIPCIGKLLPFAYESTGAETFFRDERDPFTQSRRVFSFHKPETLLEWTNQGDTLRARLRQIPLLNTTGLRKCQVEAVTNLEKSFRNNLPRSLIQMATGSGKTYTAVSFAYRLIKFAKARRILFLVDRGNLGRQTEKEFQQYITPDDGRKFTELYNIQRLKSNYLDPISKVSIATIQRVYSMLRGDELDPENEEQSLFYSPPLYEERSRDVVYNRNIPIETFDFIVTDECHRSIYNLWRQVLEYFDAFIIGLTATPSKQTLGFFHKNLVTEYSHERAVADGVNVGYEVYRIKTKITENGSEVEKGHYIDKRDRLTRKRRWEQLDEDLVYGSKQLDRNVVAEDQIRTIIRNFRDDLFTKIFPGRVEVPKTLIFAKDDSHAEDIVHIVREEFARGNEFCKKITYRSTEKTEDLIQAFRNSYNPRIVVTVDMISTGTDIKPLECLIFMRDVKSRVYFEQMKGRGSRVIDPDELQRVNPDSRHKTHFVIVDAVGVCESDKTDSRPLERKKSVPFKNLLQSVALGNREDDVITSLAGRLARLDQTLTQKQKEEIGKEAGGASINDIANRLIDSIDQDIKLTKAEEMFDVKDPTDEQVEKAAEMLKEEACEPFYNPDLRNIILDMKRKNDQTIDIVSIDEVIFSGYDEQAKEKAQNIIDTFRKYIEDNRDYLTALSVIYDMPYQRRHLTYKQIKELADSIGKPPYNLKIPALWQAYEHLEKARKRGAGADVLLTDIVTLIRYASGLMNELKHFPEVVEERFLKWIEDQEKAGKKFTDEQKEWLVMIKNYIATSMSFEASDFENSPFTERGGSYKAVELFGKENVLEIIEELNGVLAA
ncbi:MAG: DEAD/DEAH box helicase family protein [Candidatus Eremiobacteraeota bacterium]|nr:DEAD/DEAH box helicase family protein [Candidatus Eremiobacteraeota bacterium]